MTTAFDLVRAVAGEEAGPSLVEAVESMSQGRIDELSEALTALAPTTSLPDRPVTEIWPLIPMRASLFFDRLDNEVAAGYAPAGVRLSSAADPRLAGIGMFSSGILRALLYSHGLAIEDPLRHAAGMHLTQSKEMRTITRRGLSAAIASLSEIADLLDTSIVALFYTEGAEAGPAAEVAQLLLVALANDPNDFSSSAVWDSFETEFTAGLSAPLRDLWTRIRLGDPAPDLELIRKAAEIDPALADTFVEIVALLNTRTIKENAVESVASTIAMIAHLGGNADVLSTSNLMSRLLFAGAPDPAEQLRVHELGRISVPNLGAISPGDLVSIRASSDALATWRTDLALALGYADRQRKAGLDISSINAGVSELLTDAGKRVQREAGRSGLWSKANLVSFVAGALGGGGGAIVGGTAESLGVGAAAGTTSALVAAAAQRKRVPGFLQRHYLTFARAETDA